MDNKMAVITKHAYNAGKIETLQLTAERFDDKDSGWRLFKGDEDDHVLDRMECFRLITLEDAVNIQPLLKNVFDSKTECTYYHLGKDGSFHEGDSFEAEDATDADPFLSSFMAKGK